MFCFDPLDPKFASGVPAANDIWTCKGQQTCCLQQIAGVDRLNPGQTCAASPPPTPQQTRQHPCRRPRSGPGGLQSQHRQPERAGGTGGDAHQCQPSPPGLPVWGIVEETSQFGSGSGNVCSGHGWAILFCHWCFWFRPRKCHHHHHQATAVNAPLSSFGRFMPPPPPEIDSTLVGDIEGTKSR